MSFTGSISNALSGLRASSLAAELVSSNLANATNENYATRNIEVSSRVNGTSGGVRIDGITRSVDPTLLDEWRRASASTSELDTTTGYLSRVEELFGAPDDAGSLADLMTRFESALVSAASRPDLTNRLQDVYSQANDLVTAFSQASSGVQSLRTEIDQGIGRMVADLNSHLSNIVELNTRISRAESTGDNTQALYDIRQEAIDKVSEIVPLRVLPRDRGAVALVTTSGAVLLDGNAAEIEFTAATMVTEFKSLENGALSGLTIDGIDIPVGSESSRVKGGRMAALFELRDDTLVTYQAEVDALARNLVERFESSGLDPTIGVNDPGLFTDNGQAFDTTEEVGLARRLSLNDQVNPDAGGALWRLRDGLYATIPGPPGQGDLILSMIDRLNEDLTVASGDQAGLAATASELTTTLFSKIGADLSRTEDRLSFAAARSSELTEQKLRSGVDTDTELQKLLQIEKAYAANAQVLKTVDEMYDLLLGIT